MTARLQYSAELFIMLSSSFCCHLKCFISFSYCIIEGLVLHIVEYFFHELLFDDLIEQILHSLSSHGLINATVVKMFERIITQFLLHHVSWIFELSQFTFGYNRCSILADWFNIEFHVVLTNLFHFLPEGGLHLINPLHPLNEVLSRLILLPLLFGCQFLLPHLFICFFKSLLLSQLLLPQLPILLQLPLSDQSHYPIR